MSRSVVKAVLALAMVGAASVVAAAPAMAAPAAVPGVIHLSPGQGCPGDYFCIFGATNFGGGGYAFPSNLVYGSDFRDIAFDNRAESMINNTGHYEWLFAGFNCQGSAYRALPHSVDSTFSNNSFMNVASSVRRDIRPTSGNCAS